LSIDPIKEAHLSESVRKADFLKNIRCAHQALESLLGKFPQPSLERPAACQDWTARDVMAHIAWYEAEMVNVLAKRALLGSDWWDLPLDQRNAAIYAANRDASWQVVVEKEASAYQAMLNLLETLDESALNDPSAFTGMPADWQPWSVIASNTYEHYQDHLSQLQACLEN
jgi:hypothetical protein